MLGKAMKFKIAEDSGDKLVNIVFRREFRKPYPVAVDGTVQVDHQVADKVIVLGDMAVVIDGERYSGEVLIVLGKNKPA